MIKNGMADEWGEQEIEQTLTSNCVSIPNTIAVKMNRSLNRIDNTSFDNILLAKFIIFGDPFTMNLNLIDRKVGGSNLVGVMKSS